MLTLASTAACLITDPVPFVTEGPVTPPRIIDQAGVTMPRLGNLVVFTQAPMPAARVDFRIPVEDDGLNDPIQFAFFYNRQPRDCVSSGADGGVSCEPDVTGAIEPDGTLRRVIVKRIDFPEGCHRVDLWVTSSRFTARGNYHTPVRVGDVAFASWWIFVPITEGSPIDIRSSCPLL